MDNVEVEEYADGFKLKIDGDQLQRNNQFLLKVLLEPRPEKKDEDN